MEPALKQGAASCAALLRTEMAGQAMMSLLQEQETRQFLYA
jgi:hypothetical protein